MEHSGIKTVSSVPQKTYGQLFWAMALPYFLYSFWPSNATQPGIFQASKALTLVVLVIFLARKLKFPPIKGSDLYFSLLGLPLALVAWCLPLVLGHHLEWITPISNENKALAESTWGLYHYARAFNSIFLASWAEEIFHRLWFQPFLSILALYTWREWLNKLSFRWDNLADASWVATPIFYKNPGFWVSALFFVTAHQVHEYISALLYFAVTQWFFEKSKSFYTALFIHILANATLTLFVYMGQTHWWF